jgi:hypothetical protein
MNPRATTIPAVDFRRQALLALAPTLTFRECFTILTVEHLIHKKKKFVMNGSS